MPRAAPPQPRQPAPVKANPRIDNRQLSPQGPPPKQPARDPRRSSASAGVAKSPVTPQAPSHVETLPLLISVAEDCFEKANAGAPRIARSMTASEVAEHHKLVATGLGCLDVALKSNKLWPRLEARLCLRYASILIDQTTNIMEAETTLTRGIAVCEKVATRRPRGSVSHWLIPAAAPLPRPEVQFAVPPHEDAVPAKPKGSVQVDRKLH